MKLRKIICIVLLFLLLFATGCNNVTPNQPSSTPSDEQTSTPSDEQSSTPSDEQTSTPPDEQTSTPSDEPGDTTVKRTYSILFIGNSYTYFNDMPTAIFEKFAEAAGYEIKVTAITKGAHKLYEFADPTDEYGAIVESALRRAKKYDYVILQEQSELPASENVSQFYSAVRNLSERIKATGATPILYATWGRKTGSSTLDTHGWTNESMTWKLAAAYQAISEELDIQVVHAGLAFYDVYTTQNSIELYDSDKSHPSYEGSYLAAATLFAGIFNVDPTDVTYTGSISSTTATVLRQAAKKAVFETPSIPDEYQTTSKGVG